jgi:hypothetical protein
MSLKKPSIDRLADYSSKYLVAIVGLAWGWVVPESDNG